MSNKYSYLGIHLMISSTVNSNLHINAEMQVSNPLILSPSTQFSFSFLKTNSNYMQACKHLNIAWGSRGTNKQCFFTKSGRLIGFI